MFSKAKHKTPVKMEWVTITPSQAEKVLMHTATTGFPQRPLSQSVASRYTSEMKNGSWHSHTADVIRLCQYEGDYACLDGQHRLKSIARSGIEQDMWVAFDVPEEAFKYVDQGAARSLTHVMSSAGWPSPGTLASCGAMLYANHRGTNPMSNKGIALASGTLFDWVASKHADLPSIIENYGKDLKKAARRCNTQEAVMVFMFYHWEKEDHDSAFLAINYLADSYEQAPPDIVWDLALARLDDNAKQFAQQKAQGMPVRSEMQRYQQAMTLRFAWELFSGKLAKSVRTVKGFNRSCSAYIKQKRDDDERAWQL